MSVRKRALPFAGPGTTYRVYNRRKDDGRTSTIDAVTNKSYAPKYLQGTQVTVSENHPSWRRSIGRGLGDVGGPFSSQRQYATLRGGNASLHGVTDFGPDYITVQVTDYSGLCLPSGQTLSFPPYANSADNVLNALGAKAIDGCKPTNIFVDLSTSLAEFVREGIPRMDVSKWKDSVDAARKVSGNFLAEEFGFAPVVSDVKNVALAHYRANAAIQQYVRDSGRVVRRRYDFQPQESEVITVTPGVRPFTLVSTQAITDLFSPPGSIVQTRRTTVRRWFSGAFTYHLPLDDSLEEMSANALRAKGLVDLELTPETLWNLVPWSWAVDWAVPVSSYISNLQDWSSDGLVMRYGYMMEHSTCSDTYTYTGKNSQAVGSLTLTSESKKRIRANPFGFGLSWEGLSPRRLAILTALGISRS